MVGGAEFGNFADAFERLDMSVDAEEAFEGVGEVWGGEEVLIIEELLELVGWDEGCEKEE